MPMPPWYQQIEYFSPCDLLGQQSPVQIVKLSTRWDNNFDVFVTNAPNLCKKVQEKKPGTDDDMIITIPKDVTKQKEQSLTLSSEMYKNIENKMC